MDPRPAATVIIVRSSDAANAIEVLILKRSEKLDFAGGSYVFPGGAVDDDDLLLPDESMDIDDQSASKRLGIDDGGIAYYVAAARESFEEAGILFANVTTSNGLLPRSKHVSLVEPTAKITYDQHRKNLNNGSESFRDFVISKKLRLTLSDLHYVGHWVTPPGRTRRYDTRFFLAVVPVDQDALHDDGETVAHLWVTPSEALRRHESGAINLQFPTVSNLSAIKDFQNIDELVTWASGTRNIPRISPIVRIEGASVIYEIPDEQL